MYHFFFFFLKIWNHVTTSKSFQKIFQTRAHELSFTFSRQIPFIDAQMEKSLPAFTTLFMGWNLKSDEKICLGKDLLFNIWCTIIFKKENGEWLHLCSLLVINSLICVECLFYIFLLEITKNCQLWQIS